VRFEGTVGLVVERTRPDDKDGENTRLSPRLAELTPRTDALRWYCPKLESHPDGPHIVKESRFHCTDLGTQLKPVIDEWHRDEAGRKCSCGYAVGTRELIGRQTVA
jgi:3-hydroxyanthranilate 3,4-dioxygenase